MGANVLEITDKLNTHECSVFLGGLAREKNKRITLISFEIIQKDKPCIFTLNNVMAQKASHSNSEINSLFFLFSFAIEFFSTTGLIS